MTTRVTLFGVGRVARDVTRLLRARPDFSIVAAWSRNTGLIDKDLGEVAGGTPLGVTIVNNRAQALSVPADIIVIATTSFLRDVAPDIQAGVEHNRNVICTAEEMAFPWLIDEAVAGELDQLARRHGVTVLGGGVNPGFLSDALVLTAASAAWDVDHIVFKRAVNLSRFSATILRRLGIGFSAGEFNAGTGGGTIFGHIGFPQSMHLVAHALGERVEKITKRFEPILAERDYQLDQASVGRGLTAGFRQFSTAFVNGRPWFDAEFLGHLDPESVGATLEDSVDIEGTVPVHLSIKPGLRAQPASAALIANSLSRVVEAPPGLLTVADLRPARPSPTLKSALAAG